MNDDITIRPAVREDAPALLELTRGLAACMGRDGEVAATAEGIAAGLFDEGAGEALLAEHARDGVVGCAIFCRTFSTWTGRCGAYLEDLFVKEPYRGAGVGRTLMAHLAALCEERGYGRLSWHCRDTNESGLAFYARLGAQRVDPLVLHRLEGAELAALAGRGRSGADGETQTEGGDGRSASGAPACTEGAR